MHCVNQSLCSLLAVSIDPLMPRLLILTILSRASYHPSALRISYLISWVILISIYIRSSQSHQPSNEFINLMLSYSLYSLISKPTRITSSTATLIDNIFINNLELNMNSSKPLFSKLNILSLHSLYKFHVSCFVFSHFNRLLPASLLHSSFPRSSTLIVIFMII